MNIREKVLIKSKQIIHQHLHILASTHNHHHTNAIFIEQSSIQIEYTQLLLFINKINFFSLTNIAHTEIKRKRKNEIK